MANITKRRMQGMEGERMRPGDDLWEVADRACWVGLGLLFSGHYEDKPWVPALWILPYCVTRVVWKIRKAWREA